jgi:hypothetical protein
MEKVVRRLMMKALMTLGRQDLCKPEIGVTLHRHMCWQGLL